MTDNGKILYTVVAIIAAIFLVVGLGGKKKGVKEGFWNGISLASTGVTDVIMQTPGKTLTSVLPKGKFLMVPGQYQASPDVRMAPATGFRGTLKYGMNNSDATMAMNAQQPLSLGCPTQSCMKDTVSAAKRSAQIVETYSPCKSGDQFSASSCDAKGMAGYQTGASYQAALSALPQDAIPVDGIVSGGMDTVDALGNVSQVYTVKNLMTVTGRGGRLARCNRDMIRGDLAPIPSCNLGWFHSAPSSAAISKGALWAMGGAPSSSPLENNAAALAATLASATLGTNQTVSGVPLNPSQQVMAAELGGLTTVSSINGTPIEAVAFP